MIGSSTSRGRCRAINPNESDYSRVIGPVESRGPIVEVEIQPVPSELERYRMENRIVPPPIRAKGIIDTGAQRTCIWRSTVSDLWLEPVEQTTLTTASGSVKSAVFHLNLQFGLTCEHLPDPIPVRAHVVPELLDAQMLIGLDVLRLGEFVVYGPDNRYELILPRGTKPST